MRIYKWQFVFCHMTSEIWRNIFQVLFRFNGVKNGDPGDFKSRFFNLMPSTNKNYFFSMIIEWRLSKWWKCDRSQIPSYKMSSGSKSFLKDRGFIRPPYYIKLPDEKAGILLFGAFRRFLQKHKTKWNIYYSLFFILTTLFSKIWYSWCHNYHNYHT